MSAATGTGNNGSTTPDLTGDGKTINLEAIRLQVSSIVARVQSRVSLETLRPLPEFLGVNATTFRIAPGALNMPAKNMDSASMKTIQSRVELNSAYFLSNYALIVAMTALIVTLMHPGMILSLGLVYGLWMGHAFMLRRKVEAFGTNVNNMLSVQQRSYALILISFLVILWTCLVPALTVLILSGIMILAHAALRDPKHVQSSSSFAETSGGPTVGSEKDGLLQQSQDMV